LGIACSAPEPPFRGRPCRLVPAHRRHQGRAPKREKGQITAEQLKASRGRRDQKIIANQEDAARSSRPTANSAAPWWHFDFLCALDGVEMKQIEHGIQFAGVQTKASGPTSSARSASPIHPMIEHFKFPEGEHARHAEDDDPLARR
jgi:5-methyltetrahydropteroyltriglutamate--homocysteine methyltransferase